MVRDQRRQLIINVLSNYGTFMLYGLANFILLGYVVRKLGNEAFGVVSLVISLTFFTNLLGTGVCQGLAKHVAASISKRDQEKVAELASSSLLWFIICGIVGASAVAVLSLYIDRLFEIPPALVDTSKRAMQIMALNVLICFPFSTFQGILWAYQRYDLINIARVTAVVLRVAGAIAYFELVHPGIIELIAISILSLFVERILWVVFSIRVGGKLALGISLITRRAFIILISFGSLMLVLSVANLLGYEAVKWVIGRELSLIDVGGYTIIATLAMFAGALVRSVASVLMPAASRLHALEQYDTNVRLTLLATKYSMVISSALCIMPVLLLRPFLALWVGDSYSELYLLTLARGATVLLLGQWCVTAAVCMVQILTGVGKIKFPAFVTLAWALGGLAGVWAYLHWVNNSLIATIIGISIARAAGSVVHLFYGMATLKIDRIRFLLQSIIKPSIAGGIACGGCALLVQILEPYKLNQFILAVGGTFIVYALATWILVFNREEKAATVRFLKQGLCKFGFAKAEP